MRELLVATKNPGKFREAREALGGCGLELVFLGDVKVDDGDFVEDGVTFEENARKKARYYYEKLGERDGRFEFVLGEDSGIVVDVLKGELGVKTRRWGAGEKAGDQEWVEYFLRRMAGENERGAEFICCACLIVRGEEKVFKGETKGVITQGLEVPIVAGIPLSSCFRPKDFDKVYAALSVEEKNRVSHRGKAMRGVRDFLEALNLRLRRLVL